MKHAEPTSVPRVSDEACALACFTFDNMAEAADVGAGLVSEPLGDAVHPSLAIGYPRLFDLLERYRVRATFFVEGWNGVRHPAAVAEIVQRGHEVGMHGWTHESWSELDEATERALATRATDALQRATGRRPQGFRAPGGSRSAATASILRELGYRYDASLGDGMRPALLGPGLAQIPFVWPAVDGYYYIAGAGPAEPIAVAARWLDALARTTERGGLFVLVCHAFLTGVDGERLAALERVVAHAVADRRVTVLTAGDVAARLLPAEPAVEPPQ